MFRAKLNELAFLRGYFLTFLATIFYPVRQGWAAGVSDAVETLTGRKPIPLATYARDNADAWKA